MIKKEVLEDLYYKRIKLIANELYPVHLALREKMMRENDGTNPYLSDNPEKYFMNLRGICISEF